MKKIIPLIQHIETLILFLHENKQWCSLDPVSYPNNNGENQRIVSSIYRDKEFVYRHKSNRDVDIVS